MTGVYNNRTTVDDIVGATVAVDDPATIAELTSTVFLGTEGDAVQFLDRRIEFVAQLRASGACNALHLTASNTHSVGESKRLTNVDFRLV